MRGIDLILEEGLNVKVVLFPDGDDPDSYSKKHSYAETLDFITANAKDFVVFKTGLLLNEVQDDPVRKAQLIRDIVETISKFLIQSYEPCTHDSVVRCWISRNRYLLPS